MRKKSKMAEAPPTNHQAFREVRDGLINMLQICSEQDAALFEPLRTWEMRDLLPLIVQYGRFVEGAIEELDFDALHAVLLEYISSEHTAAFVRVVAGICENRAQRSIMLLVRFLYHLGSELQTK